MHISKWKDVNLKRLHTMQFQLHGLLDKAKLYADSLPPEPSGKPIMMDTCHNLSRPMK